MTKQEKLTLAVAAAGLAYLVLRGGSKRDLGDKEFAAAARALASQHGIAPSIALAMLDIESGGDGFRDGRLVIRYEPHVFKKRAGQTVPAKRGGQDAEYDNLNRAVAVDRKAAFESVSMGAAQIMGFNHKVVGYPTAEAMWRDFGRSELAQVRAMFRFLAANKKLYAAIKAGDYPKIAYYYNGPGGVGVYDVKLANRRKVWQNRGYA